MSIAEKRENTWWKENGKLMVRVVGLHLMPS